MLAASTGCLRTGALSPPLQAPEGPIHLGWRWLPGEVRTYRTLVTRSVGPVRFIRAEDWRYTATDLNHSGIVTVHGELVALGTQVVADGHDVSEDRMARARAATAAQSTTSVDLALRISGKVVALSVDGFGDALPHRMLALHLPGRPILPGETWAEEGLARTFDAAVPVDVDTTSVAQATLRDVVPSASGWLATIEHLTRVQVGALGPSLEIVGTSTWHTDPGAVVGRTIQARWLPDAVEGLPIGKLHVTLERIDRG